MTILFECFIFFAELNSRLDATLNRSRVYFDVFRKEGQTAVGNIVTYQGVNVNVGDAMDYKEGIFTAPHDGVYMFSFTAVKIENSFDLRFLMQRNGVVVTTTYGSSEGDTSITLSMFVILQLNRGDRMTIQHHTGTSYDTQLEMFTHFSGALLS